jgi:hypothetical protein
MNCEVCENEMDWEYDEDKTPTCNAVNAQSHGIVVKHWDGGKIVEQPYHFFCSRVCASAFIDLVKIQ